MMGGGETASTLRAKKGERSCSGTTRTGWSPAKTTNTNPHPEGPFATSSPDGEFCRSRALPVAVSGGAHDDDHPAVNAGSLDACDAGWMGGTCVSRMEQRTQLQSESSGTAAADSASAAAATATRRPDIARPGLEIVEQHPWTGTA